MSDQTQNDPEANEPTQEPDTPQEAVKVSSDTPDEVTGDVKDEAPEVVAPSPLAPPVEAPPAPDPATTQHVAIRDFVTRFEHQLLAFTKGQVIDHRVGHALRSMGAPIKVIEKLAEETQERQ